MIQRYQTPAMAILWSDQAKFAYWLEVEIAHYKAREPESKLIDFFNTSKKNIDWESFTNRVHEYESLVKHDVIAFLKVLEDQFGESARELHKGLTSSDIVDTAFALQLSKASKILEKSLEELLRAVWKQVQTGRQKLCLGRTHGQAAQPTTFAIKLAGHLCELSRGLVRIKNARASIAVGKLSGAVGNYAYSSSCIELKALSDLGLKPENIATQIVARDRHAQFFTTLALVGGSLERLMLELRLLMHGALKEASEPFSQQQQGSSAMPHKKNPVLCENISGLMRLIRSYALASLENQALWHERDISHSSVERVIAPDATHIMDFALKRSAMIMSDLNLDYERMDENLLEAGPSLASQALMIALIDKGLWRSDAYKLVQQATLNSNKNLRISLLEAGIKKWLTEEELDALLAMPKVIASEELLLKRAEEVFYNAIHSDTENQP